MSERKELVLDFCKQKSTNKVKIDEFRKWLFVHHQSQSRIDSILRVLRFSAHDREQFAQKLSENPLIYKVLSAPEPTVANKRHKPPVDTQHISYICKGCGNLQVLCNCNGTFALFEEFSGNMGFITVNGHLTDGKVRQKNRDVEMETDDNYIQTKEDLNS